MSSRLKVVGINAFLFDDALALRMEGDLTAGSSSNTADVASAGMRSTKFKRMSTT